MLLAGAAACGGTDASSPAGAGGAAGAAAGGASALAELPVVPACGAETPQGGNSAGTRGTYTVPVDEALTPYASFPLDGIQFCDTGGTVTLSYKFPTLLLGSDQHVDFSGALDRAVPEYMLSSSRGTARCTAPAAGAAGAAVVVWSCKETLSGLAIDSEKLDAALAALPPVEASARRQVATAFGQDPIGVLEFSEP